VDSLRALLSHVCKVSNGVGHSLRLRASLSRVCGVSMVDGHTVHLRASLSRVCGASMVDGHTVHLRASLSHVCGVSNDAGHTLRLRASLSHVWGIYMVEGQILINVVGHSLSWSPDAFKHMLYLVSHLLPLRGVLWTLFQARFCLQKFRRLLDPSAIIP